MLNELINKRDLLNTLLAEKVSSSESFKIKISEILDENISNPNLDIDFICAILGISRANMYRKFKTLYKLTPIEIIRKRRFEIAVQLLSNTDLNVGEVSLMSGFRSYEHFSRSFKKIYGLAPSKFMRKSRKMISNNR